MIWKREWKQFIHRHEPTPPTSCCPQRWIARDMAHVSHQTIANVQRDIRTSIVVHRYALESMHPILPPVTPEWMEGVWHRTIVLASPIGTSMVTVYNWSVLERIDLWHATTTYREVSVSRWINVRAPKVTVDRNVNKRFARVFWRVTSHLCVMAEDIVQVRINANVNWVTMERIVS